MSELVVHEDLGQYLTSEYELLVTVLESLSPRDLWRASQVCKRWNAAAISVRSKRCSNIETFFWLDWDFPSFQPTLRRFVDELSLAPSFVFLFVNDTLEEQCSVMATKNPNCPCFSFKSDESSPKTCRKKRCRRTGMKSFVKHELPLSAELLCIQASGIIGTYRHNVEWEEQTPCASMLLGGFPKNVDICTVPLDTFLDSKDRENGVDSLQRLLEDKKVKAFLPIFSLRVRKLHEKLHLIDAVLKRNRHKGMEMAVGGGLVKLVQKFDSSVFTGIGIAFCGENVKAASLVIPSHVKTRTELQPFLKDLSDSGIVGPEEKSYGFMFACVGRGQLHYRERNVESSMFREYFPNTPLVGCFGEGEIGINYNNRQTEHKSVKLLSYTTVFVVLSVKKE